MVVSEVRHVSWRAKPAHPPLLVVAPTGPAPSHRDSLSFRVSSFRADQVAPGPFLDLPWRQMVDQIYPRDAFVAASLPRPKHHSGLLDCARDASRGVCRKSVSGCHLSAHAVLVRHDSYLSYVFVGKLGLRCCCGNVSRSLCKRSSVRTLWDQVWSRREVQWQRTRSTPASKTMGARDPDGPDAPSLQPLSLVSF